MKTIAIPFASEYVIKKMSAIQHDVLVKELTNSSQSCNEKIKDLNLYIEHLESTLHQEPEQLQPLQRHLINQYYEMLEHHHIKANTIDDILTSLDNPQVLVEHED